MKFLIGEKVKMTQTYREDGRVVPVTVISATPKVVTQLKNAEKDGYEAVQLGAGEKKNLSKALAGHLKGVAARYVREFRPRMGESLPEVSVGDKLDVSQFEPGETVKVTGTSKGRGFQGVVKRHGFHGSPASHGHKDQLRMPGSIGSTGPQRVFKGTRMGGRMGADQVTISNLEVVAVDAKKNEILVKGAIPGAPRSVVYVQA